MERERERKRIRQFVREPWNFSLSFSQWSFVLPASPHFRGLKSSVSIRGSWKYETCWGGPALEQSVDIMKSLHQFVVAKSLCPLSLERLVD